jgi:hypothetical protein
MLIKPKTRRMFISVHHQINNPEEFWASAQKNLRLLPAEGVHRVLNVFPSHDMCQATCIWEADSVETLDDYLRARVNDWSEETYFEIDVAHAMGLPGTN